MWAVHCRFKVLRVFVGFLYSSQWQVNANKDSVKIKTLVPPKGLKGALT